MTNVSVKLSNGTARSFNTSYTSAAVVKSVALADKDFAQSLVNLSPEHELAVLAVLDGVYSGELDNVRIINPALAAAGISEVIIGFPAPVAAPVPEDLDEEDDDDEVPATEDLPVYRQTVEAQERPQSFASVKSTVADFKAGATVSRTLAIVAGAVALVVGAVLGGSIF